MQSSVGNLNSRVRVVRIGEVVRVPNTDLVDYSTDLNVVGVFVIDSIHSNRREGDLVLYVPPGCLVPLEGPKSDMWQFLKKRLDYSPGDTHYRIRNSNFGPSSAKLRSYGITNDRPFGSKEGDELGFALNIVEPYVWGYYPTLHSSYPGDRLLQWLRDWFSSKLGRGVR